MPNLFDPLSESLNHQLLAAHNPPGKFWEKTFDIDDDFGKLFLGLSVEFYRFQVLEKKLYDEMDIEQADELLVDWERSVGLPNSCLETTTESITRRREQVYQMFSKFQGVQKTEDFIRVAAFFGYVISIVPGGEVGVFPLPIPFMFSSSGKAAKHTIFMVLTNIPSGAQYFPLPVPIPFSSGGATFLQCIFSQLAPANVKVIVINQGDL